MEHRKLGKTGLNVSVIGLGTEYLNRRPRKTVISVVRESIERGINYFDLVFAFPEYRDNFGAAFRGCRRKVIIAGHVGCAETDGQYRLSHDAKENELLFLDLLNRLHTDYVDILIVQMVNAAESYDRVMKPGGLMELAFRFKKEGKTRFIGISGHHPFGVEPFIRGRHIDILMFPVNLAWDFIAGRREILEACADQDVGVVGMKVFAGGRLFQKRNPSVKPALYINYALSQPAVATTVPGVKNKRQLTEVLEFVDATDGEKSFDSVVAGFQEELRGNCVYCNHCLPCPVGIDIGGVLRMLDKSLCDLSDDPAGERQSLRKRLNFYYPGRIRTRRSHFKGLSLKASECTGCGACTERCPFGVDVVSRMKRATELWGTSGENGLGALRRN